jgi:hypothetical protein
MQRPKAKPAAATAKAHFQRSVGGFWTSFRKVLPGSLDAENAMKGSIPATSSIAL